MQLNEEQMAAVEHPLGQPACLIAGAGSGKTRVLTEHVRWLIRQGIGPRRICAITFTNKAAGELVERLEFAPDHNIPKVSTIHSLALSAIRRAPTGFGLQDKVTPLDEYDQTQMVKKIIDRETNPKRDGEINQYKFLEKVGFHRARGIGFAADYTDDVHDKACIEHGGYHALEGIEIKLWGIFEQEKMKNSVVDFDDMLHLVNRRLRSDEHYRSSFQKAFDHVLMDEAQDTNPVQWEFVNFLLAPEKRDFYVVGDMSQSIYAFNGAVPKILKDYSEGWRGVEPLLYRIARNHRSLPSIVYLANKIQSKMTATIPLKMQVFRGSAEEKGILRLTKACLPTDIAMSIAAEIHRDNQLKKNHLAYKDNCILVRSGMQVRDLEGALVRYRIPYMVRGGKGLLQTEEIRDIMAYLRLITNPKDYMALVRSVGMLKVGVGEVALEKIRKIANEKYDGDLIKGSASNDKLTSFVASLTLLQKYREYPVEALEQILALTNYRKYISDKYGKKDKDKVKTKLENIDRLLDLVKGLNEEQQMSTEDLVFQLTLDRAREDDKEGMVTISTVHAAKGLEWPRVFMTNLYEGSLPHKFSMGSEDEIEEERRLFYVGCTRPQDQLILCVNGMVQNGPNPQSVKPSRFLIETGIISE